MVNPAGKAPSRRKVKSVNSTAKDIAELAPSLRKLHSGFDKLTKRQKSSIANRKALQEYYPDNPRYSNDSIRKEILSYLGVAAGEFDTHTPIGEDSAGRVKTLAKDKEKNPAGFAYGGAVHRGRKAMRGSD
jgi:hypothetical protein